MAYGSLCFILLLMGMAYGNNLVYVVCFYLTTMGLAMAKLTNDHVHHVVIEKSFIKDAFAESDQIVFVVVRNTTQQTLKQVEIKVSGQKNVVRVDLKPDESQTVEILWTPEKRGSQPLPRIRIQSSYPAGMFQAWKILKSKEDVVIYPAKRGQKDFPQAGASSQDSVGILKEIREYQPGDSPKRIHWRSLAKSNQLRTLLHEGNENQICRLNWDHVSHLAVESRLEQLTLWISQAQGLGSPWELKLPNREYNSNNTNAFRLALTELANWK